MQCEDCAVGERWFRTSRGAWITVLRCSWALVEGEMHAQRDVYRHAFSAAAQKHIRLDLRITAAHRGAPQS